MEAVAPEPVAIPDRLILYDGVCGMCNRFVQIFLDLDRDGVFQFAPLQGETTAALRALHPEIPDNLDTIVFVDRGRVWLFSGAVLEASRHLPQPWRLISLWRFFPRPIRDAIYKQIAKRRYGIFGEYESCRIPVPSQMARFLP